MPPRPTLRALINAHRDLFAVIAAGGALGSLARWAIAQALPHEGRAFPTGTFITNVSGTLLIGLLMALVLGPWSHTRYLRPFLGVGVLGGYTTFSTYEVETRGLLAAGAPGTGLLYLLGSILAGLVAVAVGLVVGRALIAARARRRGHEVSHDEQSLRQQIISDPHPQED